MANLSALEMPCLEKSGPGVRIPLSPPPPLRPSQVTSGRELAKGVLIGSVQCAKTVPIKLAAEHCTGNSSTSFALVFGPPRFSASARFGLGVLPFVELRTFANGHTAASIT
jgi:hypothetical protein